MRKSNIPFIIAIVVIAVWAETFVSSKVLLNSGLMPADIFFYRFIIAYACMWCMSHKRLWTNSLSHELLFLALGVMGGSLYFLCENMALIYSTATNVAILVGTTPLVTALLMVCFYKDEHMSRKQVLGSIIAFIGMVLVVLNGQLVLHLNPKGDILAICASITWGLYSLIIKRLSPHYDTRLITRKVFGYGLLTILPYFAIVAPLQFDTSILSRPVVWGNLLYLALVASMLCFILWNWVLKRLGTVRAINIIYIQSFFTMMASAIVLSERITIMAIAGTIILILGMIWATKKTNN